MDLGLEGKVAFITGGASEIGREICLTLAKEGSKLVFSDIMVVEGEELAGEIADLGGEAIFMKTDVSQHQEVQDSVEKARNHFGRLDILVYVAGYGIRERFADSTPEHWKKQVDVCLYGMLSATHAVLPEMIRNQYGKIVSTIGDSSRVGESGLSLVAASRAGQGALIKSVAREVGRFNITLNAVSLGVVDTSHYPPGFVEKHGEKLIRQYPMGRLGKPEDVAPMVVFLCSDLSSWITGQIISVNGGYAMV
jgi:2-hydroxycyclohexanecarboxyl-CoA dehydrogenase